MNSELAKLLGVDKMAPQEQDDFLARTGEIIINAAVGKLLLTLEDEQVKKLEEYIEKAPETEDVFAYFLKTYPEFESILEGEMEAFRNGTMEIMSS